MNEEKPPVKEAIKQALVKEKRLSHNDLTFLILKDGEPSIYLESRGGREHFINLKNKFFNPRAKKKGGGKGEWDWPFRRYDVGSSAIASALDYLKRDGVVKKVSGKYELTSAIYKFDVTRALDKAVLFRYPLTDIYQHETLAAVQKRPYVPEPILRVYGMNRKVVEHADHVGMKKKLLSTLDKIEELSLEISQLKDDIGEEYKIKLFLDKCKEFDDEKIMVFVQNQFNLMLFHMLFGRIEEFYVRRKTTKGAKRVIDKKFLESALKDMKIYLTGITMSWIGGHDEKTGIFIPTEGKSPSPTEKYHKTKKLSSEQIKKIVKAIVKVDRECKNIYDMGVYPSIMVNQCISRGRTGADYEVLPAHRVTKDMGVKPAGVLFKPLKTRMEK